MTRLIRELNTEYLSLEKLRDDLVKKYGEPVEGQEGSVRVSEDNRAAFLAEFQELLVEKVNVDWELVSIEDPGFAALSLTVRELNVLGWLFTEFKELANEAASQVATEAAEGEFAEEAADECDSVPEKEPAEVG
jgi:hypothetical protein